MIRHRPFLLLLLLALPLYGCDSESTSLVAVPAVEFPAYCRHEAVFCALVIAEYTDEEPVIRYGEQSDGTGHVECYLPESHLYVRMTYFGVYTDPEPRVPMNVLEEFSVADYQLWANGWAVE